MAEDTIKRVKLELGKKAAAVNRKAALILELSRLRLEAGNLRGERKGSAGCPGCHGGL